MKLIDDFLNRTTMYRLVLYYLIFLVLAGLFLSGVNLIISTILLLIFCWVTNKIFAKVFKVATNLESVYISALILTLIIAPVKTIHDLPFLFWAAVWAMAGKYIFVYKGKHLFNPVALGVLLPSIFLGESATWWVGSKFMLLPVLIGGFLVVRKIRRWNMVIPFLIITGIFVLHSPVLFFAFVMLTEPLTAPSTKNLQILYGILVGILFIPQLHLGQFYTTPESALLMGNIFSFLVSPKGKLILQLQEKIKIAPDIYDFVFSSNQKMSFVPGKYLELTLGHKNPDSRGNRRYLTITSSPTENNLRLGIKFPDFPSSFKKSLLDLNINDKISVSQIAGDFLLPATSNQKLVFIAGGIGITPFRSMVKYLTDTNQKWDIILLYCAKTADEFIYQEIFKDIKTVYKVGRLEKEDIPGAVPDFSQRLFYLSGPHSMVDNFEKLLADLGVHRNQIKTDYFPGY